MKFTKEEQIFYHNNHTYLVLLFLGVKV